jgi:hypothetical protein
MAKRGEPGVRQVADGIYETARARAAGRAAQREVYGEVDPAVAAALRSLNRMLRAISARAPVDADRPMPGPPSRR